MLRSHKYLTAVSCLKYGKTYCLTFSGTWIHSLSSSNSNEGFLDRLVTLKWLKTYVSAVVINLKTMSPSARV